MVVGNKVSVREVFLGESVVVFDGLKEQDLKNSQEAAQRINNLINHSNNAQSPSRGRS